MLTQLAHPWRHQALIRILTWREVSGRYRGSLLGSLWSLLTPLLLQGIGMFALRLLAGMVIHGLLSEALGKAPILVTSQPNYVNKVVFPLEVLAWVNLLAALFHSAMAMVVLILLNALVGTGLAWSLLALPVIVLPFTVLLMGLSWLIAALGVYLRDINQLIGPLIMVTMFLGPVFYPRSAMPAAVQSWLVLNPITIPTEQLRRVLFDAQWPQWDALAQYALVAVVVYVFGLWVFTKLKKGFADVL